MDEVNKVTVYPTTTVLTLAEAKLHLRVDTTDEEAAITGYIWAAQQQVESHTGKALLQQTMVESLADFPGKRDPIRLTPPLQSVSSIVYWATTDSSSAATTMASSDYVVDTLQGRVVPMPNCSWPTVRDGASPGVQVTHVSGTTFATTDHNAAFALERAAMRLSIGHQFANRGDEETELPEAAKSLLSLADTGNRYGYGG